MTERWAPVVGYKDFYEVSDTGLVRSLERRVRQGDVWRVLRARPLRSHPTNVYGHRSVKFHKDGRGTTFRVHRLVLEAFVGLCPEGTEACHRDGNPGNNCIENLYWGTHTENMQDRIQHGRNPFLNMTHCKWGHEFTPGNTVIRPDGRRSCYICRRRSKAAYLARKRNAVAS